MKFTYLDFEQPLAELNERIEELRLVQNDSALDISEELSRLTEKNNTLLESIYKKLDPWKISQIARHPQRPYSLDIISSITTNFVELHGDRTFADDPAIVGGLAKFDGQPVMVIGHQKGRNLNERTYRNFGMPKPEGYRKAARLMKMAEKFALPILTFVDTPGAYPGIGAEERGQSEAIGQNLFLMSGLKTPIISSIIGEGGSGGALAISVSDRLLMFKYAIYSVISPEGCASILWKDSDKARDAAEILGITADRLKKLKLVDLIVDEPLGGAHRDYSKSCENLKNAISESLASLNGLSADELVSRRQEKIRGFGKFKEAA
ncbi:MAG: acetyl-CoA carboxylase carboxyl transferase subunit alpha [Betaproteobacteria bacterium TMED156]|nr:MAG: acetyl-CoA carboxylase carboxyl transferase subunit alpha [Betaproteobacteria bacterium TMED156]